MFGFKPFSATPFSGQQVTGTTLDVSVAEALVATQYGRPDGTITPGSGWFATGAPTLHEALDEVSPDDITTYVAENLFVQTDTFEVSLSNFVDPGVSTGHIMRMRFLDTSGGSGSWNFTLKQGATVIVSVGTTSTGIWDTVIYTLTGAEADAITDYNNLRFEVSATDVGVSADYYVSQLELEVPGQGSATDTTTVVPIWGGTRAETLAAADTPTVIATMGVSMPETATAADTPSAVAVFAATKSEGTISSDTNRTAAHQIDLSNLEYGETFVGNGEDIKAALFEIYTELSAVGTAEARIYSVTGTPGVDAVPNALLATSRSYDVAQYAISNATRRVESFIFDTPFTTTAGTNYIVTLAGILSVGRIRPGGTAAGAAGISLVRYNGSWASFQNQTIYNIVRSVAAVDTDTGAPVYPVSVAETATAADTSDGQTAGINGTTNETASAADTPTVVATFVGSDAETASATDTETTTAVFVATDAESAAAADTPSTTAVFVATDAESAAAADTPSTVAVFVATRAEAAAATDTPSTIATFVVTDAETATAADTPTATAVFVVARAEAGSAADTETGVVVYPVSVAESGSAADTPSSVVVYPVTVAEAATAVDTSDAAQQGQVNGTVNESASAADTPTVLMTAPVTRAESASAVDTPSGVVVYAASMAETASAADTQTAARTQVASVSEVGIATETQIGLGVFVCSRLESVTIVDNCATGSVYDVVRAEALSAADTTTGAVNRFGTIAEQAAAHDDSNYHYFKLPLGPIILVHPIDPRLIPITRVPPAPIQVVALPASREHEVTRPPTPEPTPISLRANTVITVVVPPT